MASDATKQTISQSLNDLKAEIADRTKSIITGVKIPELENTLLISPTDQVIVETDNGTKRASLKTIGDVLGGAGGNVNLQEVIDARNDGVTNYPQLKNRLDAMDGKTQANAQQIQNNKQEIAGLTNKYDTINKEVTDARESNDGVVHNTLKERLDADMQEVINARTDNKRVTTHGNLKERLDSDYDHLTNEIEETNIRVSHLEIHNTPRMTNDDIQQAIDSAVASGVNKVILEGKEYVLTDTLRIPSKFELVGVKGVTTLSLTGVDKPVIEHIGAPKGGTILRNFIIKGDNTQTNNDGIKINDYYSTIEGIDINNCGGYGINWHVTGATGTLVENYIKDVAVRKSVKDSFYLGDANNNKLTDGYLINCISQGNKTNKALHIGSSAGWQINGLHTYGHGECDNVIHIRNAFNTVVDNVYIEDFKGRGLSFSQAQKNLSISNIVANIKDNPGTDQILFHFNHSAAFNYTTNVTVNNITADCSHTGTTYIFSSDGTNVKVKVTNVYISGKNIPTKLYANNLKDKISIVDGIHVEGSLTLNGNISESGNVLTYNGGKIPTYYAFNFDGNSQVTNELTIPDFKTYSNRLARVSIVAHKNWTDGTPTYYSAEIFVVRKTANTFKVVVKELAVSSGFTVKPAYTVDADGLLTITYTPNTADAQGRTTVELFS